MRRPARRRARGAANLEKRMREKREKEAHDRDLRMRFAEEAARYRRRRATRSRRSRWTSRSGLDASPRGASPVRRALLLRRVRLPPV